MFRQNPSLFPLKHKLLSKKLYIDSPTNNSKTKPLSECNSFVKHHNKETDIGENQITHIELIILLGIAYFLVKKL